MVKLLEDASLPADKVTVEAKIDEIDKYLQENHTKIQTLMDAEDPSKQIFHAVEIHEAKQMNMLLRYQRDLRTVRLNALLLGKDVGDVTK